MAGLKVGDSFPEGIKFTYVPPKADSEITSCGIPQPYNASESMLPAQSCAALVN